MKFSIGQSVTVRSDAAGAVRQIAGWVGTVARLRVSDDGAMVRMPNDLPGELRRYDPRLVLLFPEDVEDGK